MAAVLFVVTAILAVLTVNLIQVVTDQAAINQIIDLETLVTDVTPRLVTQAALRQAQEQGTTPASPDPTALQAAAEDLFPPGWLETLGSRITRAGFSFLETGDPAAAQLQIDAGPLLSRLRGEPGRQLVRSVLEVLPECTTPPLANPTADLSQINYCMPAEAPIADVTTYTHDGLVNLIEEAPQFQTETGTIQLSLLTGPASTPTVRQWVQRIRRGFTLAQQWAWALWLFPLGSLLILALVTRSFRHLSYWWGWSLLIAGVIVLFLAFFLPPFLSATVLRWTIAAPDLPQVFLGRLGQHLLDGLADAWMADVYVQAGLMTGAGAVLLIVRYFTRAGRRSTIPH